MRGSKPAGFGKKFAMEGQILLVLGKISPRKEARTSNVNYDAVTYCNVSNKDTTHRHELTNAYPYECTET